LRSSLGLCEIALNLKTETDLTTDYAEARRSRNQMLVLVLVVVLVLEWAGKLGAEQSCQLMDNAVSLHCSQIWAFIDSVELDGK
jgi:hypothetical protein